MKNTKAPKLKQFIKAPWNKQWVCLRLLSGSMWTNNTQKCADCASNVQVRWGRAAPTDPYSSCPKQITAPGWALWYAFVCVHALKKISESTSNTQNCIHFQPISCVCNDGRGLKWQILDCDWKHLKGLCGTPVFRWKRFFSLCWKTQFLS